MDTDDSIVVCEITRRVNNFLAEGKALEDIDMIGIENDIVDDPNLVPASVRKEVRKQIRAIRKSRVRAARKVHRDIARTWSPALDRLDQCLALADLLNNRFVEAIFTNGDVLRSKDPRPDPDAVTGAYVKCLHLLALYGKSCSIATEISNLLREGFPDGAISRLRTLHEHLVIMMLLHNDNTYELCERYQDSAVFEQLKQLRTDQESLAEPIWIIPDGYVEELAQDITEAEHFAGNAVSRWGPKIKRQYEWARIALPEAKSNNPNYRITLSDLEEIAGMDFLHGNYLTGNDRIHAGAYAVINHLKLDSSEISRTRPRRDDWAIQFVGYGTAELIGWVARAASRSISWETEEYDEFLYAFETYRVAVAALEAFKAVGTTPSPPSRQVPDLAGKAPSQGSAPA